MNKVALSFALFLCMWSFLSLNLQESEVRLTSDDNPNLMMINLSALLEPLEKLSLLHHLSFVAFNPIFEQGNRAFSLDLEADFANFLNWYQDVLQKMPKLHWQHLQLKPHRGLLLIHLEGRNEA